MANTYQEFTELLKLRQLTENQEDFYTGVRKTDLFAQAVAKVLDNNNKWAEAVGLNDSPEDLVQCSLSEKEIKWKNYFASHSFSSTEEQRNLADALSISEGIDLNRFLVIEKKTTCYFQGTLCIVPVGNQNKHNYAVGKPIIIFGRGTQFYKLTGRTGNTMSTNKKDYRMGDKEEVENIILGVMYNVPGAIEHFTNIL